MELLDAIQARRSIRKFKPDPVPDNLVQELLEAARLAPSGVNVQPWRFVVVKSEEGKAKLSAGTPLPFVPGAPVVIACCIDSQALDNIGQRMKELQEAGAMASPPQGAANSNSNLQSRLKDEVQANAYLRLNAAIAIEHINLRAVDLGLGTCWVMMFDQDKIKAALALEDRYHVVALIPVGFPDQAPAPRPRLGLDELVLKEL